MKTMTSAFLLAFVAALAACSSNSPTSGGAEMTKNPITSNTGASRAYVAAHNVPSHGVALEGYCPVAYFAVNKPLRGKPEYASTYEGIEYHFVSADAQAAFDKEPAKYIPAYGGWCAFGMAVQDKFPVDPRNFKIVNGQLMLFLKNKDVDALDLWNKGNESELVSKANAHWNKVQN